MKILATLLVLSSVGCATAVTPYSSEHENAWFIQTRQSSGSSMLMYCMANKGADKAEPRCYDAEMIKAPPQKSEFWSKKKD